MSPQRLAELIDEILDDRTRKIFQTRHDLDMAYEVEGVARFRVSMFQTMRGPAAVFRFIPQEITPLEDLGVPLILEKYTNSPERAAYGNITGPHVAKTEVRQVEGVIGEVPVAN